MPRWVEVEIDAVPVAQLAGHRELPEGHTLHAVHGDRERRGRDGDPRQRPTEIDAGGVGRIAARRHFEPVTHAVTVGVGQQRIGDETVGARPGLLAVHDAVAVRIRVAQVRAEARFVAVRQRIAIPILERVGGVVGIQPERQFEVVRDAVAVAVGRQHDPHRDEAGGAFVRRLDQHGAARQACHQAIARDGSDRRITDDVLGAGAARRPPHAPGRRRSSPARSAATSRRPSSARSGSR